MQARHKLDVVQQDRSLLSALGYRNPLELSDFCRAQFTFVSKTYQDFAIFHVKHPVGGHRHVATRSQIADPNFVGQFYTVVGQDVLHFVFALVLCVAEADKARHVLCGSASHSSVKSQNMAKIVVI